MEETAAGGSLTKVFRFPQYRLPALQAVSLVVESVWVRSRLSWQRPRFSASRSHYSWRPRHGCGSHFRPSPLPLPGADCCLPWASRPDPSWPPHCFNLGSHYLTLGSGISLPHRAARSLLLKYLLTSSLSWAADRNASLRHPGLQSQLLHLLSFSPMACWPR